MSISFIAMIARKLFQALENLAVYFSDAWKNDGLHVFELEWVCFSSQAQGKVVAF